MADFKTQLNIINAQRATLELAQRQLYALQVRQQRGENITLTTIQNAQRQVLAAKTLVQTNISTLHQRQTLNDLVKNWEPEIPLLMLPVRIQTRIIGNQATAADAAHFALLVRIYPDDIFMCSHEETLTEEEVIGAKLYWNAIRLSEQPNVPTSPSNDQRTEMKKEAWRQLGAQFGGGRSLYVARQTTPLNRADLGKLTTESAIQYNTDILSQTKPKSWTEAAKTAILPDRFQVMVFNHTSDTNPIITQNGNFVSDTLTLGLNPLDENSQFKKANGEVTIGDDIKWMTDFAAAEQVGMGIRIPLTKEMYMAGPVNPVQPAGQAQYLQNLGIRRVVVVGVLNSADKTKSATLLQKAFENHLYTRKSLAFMEKGTPTNNTDEGNSAWSSYNDPLSISYYDGFKNFDDTDTTSDGARLALALGLPKSVFQTTPKAGKQDYDVAQKLNTTLYNATLGYYFEQLMAGIIPNTTELKNFFQQYVIGGGNYATLRIGYQPYGIALAGDYKKYAATDSVAFYQSFSKVLTTLETVWQQLADQVPRVGVGANPAETLIDILSLHAQSVSFEQQWFYPTDAMMKEKITDIDTRLAANRSLVLTYLRNLGYQGAQIPLAAQLVSHVNDVSTTLSMDNTVKPDIFDKDDPLSINPDFNYLNWLSTTESIRDLETLPQGSRPEVASLLFLFLRQAYLQQLVKAVSHFLQLPIFQATEARRITLMLRQLQGSSLLKSFNIPQTNRDMTIWEFLNVSLALDETHPAIGARLGIQFANKSIADCVLSKSLMTSLVKHFSLQPRVATSQISELLALRETLSSLSNIPAATLEKAFIGHLDCASHRLDAWQEGLIARRLDQYRKKKAEGIYIGAFGWVEGLKATPGGARTNGGFIHAPSPTHATAAAVLKSAFLNHKQPSGKSAFALNLHSYRLQKAQQVLERMQGGERLEVILGYQFERELNDVSSTQRNAAANTIVNFRKKYPVMTLQLPQNPTEKPTDIASTQNVVNGLTLAEDATWQTKVPVSAVVQPFIKKAIDNLADTLDAVKDLLAAETAFRMAQGNFDSVGATLDALNKGKMPHDLGFIEPSRQNLLQFTNRVALHFDTEGGAVNLQKSPRAQAEPGLNKWCGQLLGALSNIGFRAKHELLTQTTTGALAESPSTALTLTDLAIQTLDFVCLSANSAELELRAAFAYRQKLNLTDDVVVKINFSDSGSPSVRSLIKVLPLATTIQRLMTAARPLTAQDYLPNSGTETPGIIETAELKERIQGVLNDLTGVLNSIKNIGLSQTLILQEDGSTLSTLGDVFTVLKMTKHEATMEDWLPRVLSNVTTLQSQMIQLAAFGVAKAFPERREILGESAVFDLVQQAATIVDSTEQMLVNIQARLQALLTNTEANLTDIENLMRLGKLLLSGTMPMLPRFRYVNPTQIVEANSRRAELLKGSPSDPTPPDMKAEEWLQNIARVRPKLALWETLRFMASHLPLDLMPAQVPTDALNMLQADGSKKPIYTWLATEFTEGVVIRKEAVSIVVTGEAAAKTTQLQTGLLLDDWTEAIPTDEELTALAFHYDQPNAEAPQTLLLAVCPDTTWTWDAVVSSVTETLRRAKLRTVDITQIKEAAAKSNSGTALQALNKLLPLIVAPVNVQQHTLSLDFGMMDEEQRAKMAAVKDPAIPLGHYRIWQE